MRNKPSIATKCYTCEWCEREIKEGDTYIRRAEFAGTRHKTARYHPECLEMHIQEVTRKK